MKKALFLVFVGLVSSAVGIEVDPNYVSQKVIDSMNAALAGSASQWFSLPAFNVSFDNEIKSKWSFHEGKLGSIGKIVKAEDPEITYFQEDIPTVIIFVDVKDLLVNFTFGCSDFFVISGYNYSISRAVDTQATILVDTVPNGPGRCYGLIHSAPSSFTFEVDGSDFSEITPKDEYAQTCIRRSFSRRQDYSDPINKRFDSDYGDAVENMLASAGRLALSGLNLCAD